MLPLILVSYIVGLTVEFTAIYRGHQVNEGYLVTGLLIPMITNFNAIMDANVSVIFAVVIGKEVFGGTGMNILNPALTARAFAFFAYPANLSGDKIWISEQESLPDSISGATPLARLCFW